MMGVYERNSSTPIEGIPTNIDVVPLHSDAKSADGLNSKRFSARRSRGSRPSCACLSIAPQVRVIPESPSVSSDTKQLLPVCRPEPLYDLRRRPLLRGEIPGHHHPHGCLSALEKSFHSLPSTMDPHFYWNAGQALWAFLATIA